MHFWDYFVLFLVALFVGGALFLLRGRKKKGCCGSCSCCEADCRYRKEKT
ncbi:MAG: hypothetical protein GX637_07745 [Clostridiales bacterium]|nr:hypothetical protein [Clostridiales bacterium]